MKYTQYLIDKKDKLNFKIDLQRQPEKNKKTHRNISRITLDNTNDGNIFDILKHSIRKENSQFIQSSEELQLFWKDMDGDLIMIQNNDGLQIAMSEMVGPLYRLNVIVGKEENKGG